MSGKSNSESDQPETIEIDRKKVSIMLHQLTLTRERERLSPVGDEHLKTATGWLDDALCGRNQDTVNSPSGGESGGD